MCFEQDGTVSTSSDELLKFINQLTYLGSNISSSKDVVSMCLGKAWNPIDRLYGNLISDKKGKFSKWWSCQYYCMDAPTELKRNAKRKTLMEATQEGP